MRAPIQTRVALWVLAGLAILAWVLLFTSRAHATDFWVATAAAGGSDSNPGTQASPFLTIQHADNAAVAGFGPGSTVHVAPGKYFGSLGQLTAIGSAASPITYLCDVKWSCKILPTANETNNWAVWWGGSGASYSSITAIASTSSNCFGATPCLQVTISAPPGYTLATGQIIQISGAATGTAANGSWAITVVDSTHYTLNNSGCVGTPPCSFGAGGTFRTGATGAYTIWDGFDIDGTYPGTGQIWYTGIFGDGFAAIIRNNRVHDFAYVPGANNGSSGGACVNDGGGFYGQSNSLIYNNTVFHCGPKGTKQTRIHGIYSANPGAKIYNNLIYGVSGVCITSWHEATAQVVNNNTIADCLDGTFNVGSGDVDWPHLVTGNPANGSNIVTGISTTAGLVVGMGAFDQTNPGCIVGSSLDISHITSIDSPTQVHVSPAAVTNCNLGGGPDTIAFGGPNTGTYVANNLSLNGGSCGVGSFGATINNTYTNNAQDSGTTWCFGLGGGETHVNDVTITGSCLVNYTSNDGNNTDWHLAAGCGAIVAGTATNAPAFDYDLNPVPLGSAVDIGAYAYNPHPHALVDKYWNWVPGGYSSAFRKDFFAASTVTTPGTNGFGSQTRIASLDGIGDFWINGCLVVGWPSTGCGAQGSINAQSLYVNGVQIAPSPVPNPLCNSSMDFDQQLAAAGNAYTIAAGIGSPVNTLDCWNAAESSAAGTLTVQQVSTSPPTGFANYLEAKVTTGSATVGASDYFLVYQPVEAANITNYGLGGSGAQPLCVQFFSRSSVPGAIIGGAVQNAARNRSYPFIFTENATANTWQAYSVCLPGDTQPTWVTSGNNEGLRVVFALEAGANFQTGTVASAGVSGLPGSTFVPIPGMPGAWAGSEFYGSSALTQLTKTSLATFDLTGVQLEQSSISNPFARQSQAVETAQVSRYAYRLAEPAANINVGLCQATGSAAQTCMIDLPVTMRAAPGACSISGGSTFKENFAGTATTWTSPVGGTNAQNEATITTSTAGDAAGNFHMLQGGGGTGVIYCSARL